MSARRAADPRRGLLRRPALRQDDARRPALSPRRRRRDPRLDPRRARTSRRRADRGGRRRVARVRARPSALVGVATQGGRFPPAWRELLQECIRQGIAIENGLHEFVERRSRARRARRRRFGGHADRPAPTAARARRADGRESRACPARIVLTVGSDCAIGKMTVVARARPRGPQPRDRSRSSCRRARRGSRSPAGGSPSTRSSRTSSPAPPSGSSSREGAWGRAAPRRGPGRDLASRLLGRHARAASTARRRMRSCSATVPATPRSTGIRATRCSRCPSSSSCTRASACRARRPVRRLHRAQHARTSTTMRRGRRSTRPRPRPGSSPTTRSGSAPGVCSTRCSLNSDRSGRFGVCPGRGRSRPAN